jgi:hypothetical protein
MNQPETGSGPADPYAMKQAWEQFVVPAARAGKLEKIPTRKARNARERSQAAAQNAVLTRSVIGGFGENYDLIDWSKKRGQ